MGGSTNADGITQELLNVHETSLSPGELTIQEATFEGSKDTVGNSEGDVNPLLLELSSMGVNDTIIQDISAAANAPNSCATTSSPFSSFLRRDSNTEEHAGNPQVVGTKSPTETPMLGTPIDSPIDTRGTPVTTEEETSQMVITRREVLAITNVLGRIPQSLLNDPDPATTSSFTFNLIEDPPKSHTKRIARRGAEGADDQNLGEPMTYSSCEDAPVPGGKRRRPKYSLRTHMMRKHPVLKFFATGPIDRQKTPYKWWCRVCRVELSLMSRGVLELLSHFRTDSHLIKEHRIRSEVPGMPLYDRHEKVLTGTALQEAKRVAKETFPIAPQLDSCRLLVGQDKLPDSSSISSPSEDVFSQISFLEHGLRHGGNIDSLIGMWNEMVRLFPGNSQESTFGCCRERLFVSIFMHIT